MPSSSDIVVRKKSPSPVAGSASQAPTTRSQAAAAAQYTNYKDQSSSSSSSSSSGINNTPASRNALNDSFLQEYPAGNIRIGPEFQAVIPPYNPIAWKKIDEKRYNGKNGAVLEDLLLWRPPPPDMNLSDERLDHFWSIAHDLFNYSLEQALGLLHFDGYNIDKAVHDLKIFQPVIDIWSPADQALFEQAYAFNNKDFIRIKQMFKDKSIAELVKYYYGWKNKGRKQASYADQTYKKRKHNRASPDGSHKKEKSEKIAIPAKVSRRDSTDSSATDDSVISLQKPETKVSQELKCTGCGEMTDKLCVVEDTHSFCQACYLYYRRTGTIRGTKRKRGADADDNGSSSKSLGYQNGDAKPALQPPNDLKMDLNEFIGLAAIGDASRQLVLKKLEEELVQLRSRALRNKNQCADIGPCKTVREGIEAGAYDVSQLRPRRIPKGRITYKWSSYETLLAVQGFRRYGTNFAAIAEVVGNKTEAHVKNFYQGNKDLYMLDKLIAEREVESESTTADKQPEVINLEDD